jgi:hypothetical protein
MATRGEANTVYAAGLVQGIVAARWRRGPSFRDQAGLLAFLMGPVLALTAASRRRFLRLVFRQYPKRAILGATLMVTQSFLCNAIFFTYALVLTTFYGVSATKVPVYGLSFSVGNLAGPLLLGPLVGAGIMILGGVVELLIGIDAEGKSLEDVTRPLTAADG